MPFRRVLVSSLLATVVLLAGCTAGGDRDGASESDTTSTEEAPSFEMVAPPGSYGMPNGTTKVLGILTYRDLEGGFWAVAKTAVPEDAATAEIVAVVIPADAGLEADVQTLNGEYVSVVGMLNEGPSIYMAGPVIEAQSIELVSDTATE